MSYLVHGAAYFKELLAAVHAMRAGDLLLFTDWRGDPDERLDGPGTQIGAVLCAAAERGVRVKGLLWRYEPPELPVTQHVLATPLHRVLVDPDGRPLRLRRRNAF
ncbi:hypothetical protein [Streptomyces sp. NPDC046685]|uniref:hypothetical protein n=1 Tax=Streptomyces sp. NPDC046685 TaxID=3157202 RepID=UPI0033DD2E0F